MKRREASELQEAVFRPNLDKTKKRNERVLSRHLSIHDKPLQTTVQDYSYMTASISQIASASLPYSHASGSQTVRGGKENDSQSNGNTNGNANGNRQLLVGQ